jgi:hypothetical protein
MVKDGENNRLDRASNLSRSEILVLQPVWIRIDPLPVYFNADFRHYPLAKTCCVRLYTEL